jgi:uncharacterized protein (DUF427 family)
VWDYPRPPRLEPVPRRVVVEFAGVVLADSGSALRMLETSHPPTYYLPPADVRTDLLVPSHRRGSHCEWKGGARYWHVRVDARVARDAAWSYPDPFDEYAPLAGHLAFYCAAMDACRVGDLVATAQPGGFYGGWVTADLVGPFKGEPGTEGW